MDPVRIEPGRARASSFPRRPRIEPSSRRIRVVFAEVVLVDTRRALRVLERGHPPTWYLRPDDVRMDLLVPSEHETFCEWKGTASYFDVAVGDRRALDAAWTYPDPRPGYEGLAYQLAFFPGRVDACFVDEERVRAQEGAFYGGWVTSDVLGPFKGEPH